MANTTKAQQAIIEARAKALNLLDEELVGKVFLDHEALTAEDAVKFLSFIDKKNRDGMYIKSFKEDPKGIYLSDDYALTFQTVLEPFLVDGDAILFKEASEVRSSFTNRGHKVNEDLIAELQLLSGDEAIDLGTSPIRAKLRTS